MRVIIESPFRGSDNYTEEEAKAYLTECKQDAFRRGEAYFASHDVYPEFLNDQDTAERKKGMNWGFEWMQVCNLVAVYVDLGVSEGMERGIAKAAEFGKKIEFRRVRTKGEQ